MTITKGLNLILISWSLSIKIFIIFVVSEYGAVDLRGEFENWTFHHYPEMEIIKIEGRVSVASQLCPRGDC